MTAPVNVVILTYNEERNLPACLESLAAWVSQIFVVDSFSTDRTVEIARECGANVVQHRFETHAKQWNWALQCLPLIEPWVLCLDADHRVTPRLASDIGDRLAEIERGTGGDIAGFYVARRQVFRGKWIRRGGYYPKYLLKLVRKGHAKCDEEELLDFRFYVDGGTAMLRGDLIEENLKELEISFWIAKHNRFARLQAIEEMHRAKDDVGWSAYPALFGTPDQRTLWLKRLYYRMPLYVRPGLYFVYRYIFRLGFLDGKEGFIFHFLQALWYRILVDMNLEELGRSARESRPEVAPHPHHAPSDVPLGGGSPGA
jgi:glycosyltransferase involved in cell wall biosynthesis